MEQTHETPLFNTKYQHPMLSCGWQSENHDDGFCYHDGSWSGESRSGCGHGDGGCGYGCGYGCGCDVYDDRSCGCGFRIFLCSSYLCSYHSAYS